MYRIEFKIVDESSGETLRHATAYVDTRYEKVCFDSLRRVYEDASLWLAQVLKSTAPRED